MDRVDAEALGYGQKQRNHHRNQQDHVKKEQEDELARDQPLKEREEFLRNLKIDQKVRESERGHQDGKNGTHEHHALPGRRLEVLKAQLSSKDNLDDKRIHKRQGGDLDDVEPTRKQPDQDDGRKRDLGLCWKKTE